MARQITIEEVKKHKRKNSVWMIIHDDVYDVTRFLNEHPGGEDTLLEYAGKDGTQAFEDVHHSEDAREIMKKFKIGTLPPDQRNKSIVDCRSYTWVFLALAGAIALGVVWKKYLSK
ncbi:Cytochrome b5 type B [Danaus plexippus plexippus]|uniref:Cytochrome b5 n=1 Tax=Danaus plexippus plexippus TaxID=278856 RepID=A0A212F9U0_DANPL|nr:Cytochrome b5 type B [Danaus plexippus plexippus]